MLVGQVAHLCIAAPERAGPRNCEGDESTKNITGGCKGSALQDGLKGQQGDRGPPFSQGWRGEPEGRGGSEGARQQRRAGLWPVWSGRSVGQRCAAYGLASAQAVIAAGSQESCIQAALGCQDPIAIAITVALALTPLLALASSSLTAYAGPQKPLAMLVLDGC